MRRNERDQRHFTVIKSPHLVTMLVERTKFFGASAELDPLRLSPSPLILFRAQQCQVLNRFDWF